MNQLSTLYARGEKKKILEWTIVIDGNTFYTITGAQGAKKVTSEPTICYGKNIGRSNATTGEQQALMEATSRWEKKKKSKGYWEDIVDIDRTTFIEPMLANKFTARRAKLDPSSGLILQIKFNGLRCISSIAGPYSRGNERYVSIPHIEDSLEEFFKEFPDAVLDGELYNWELREQLNEVVKLCRATVNITPELLQRSERMVKYYVYDGWGFGALETDPYEKRKAVIDRELLLRCKYFEPVQDHWFYSWEELERIYQTFLEDRQEGGIIRLPYSPYERKRSNNLLKMKPTDDAEFTITSVEEGNGNWSGVAKIIGLEMPDGKRFNATFKGTKEEAAVMLIGKDKWIGRTVTIYYNGFTGLGTPNFAQFDYRNSLKG